MDAASAIDRLEFSDCARHHDGKVHIYLDKFYRGQVWHTGRGWNVDCFGIRADDLPSRDEAIEVVRMWVGLKWPASPAEPR
jgi:hypothetical protein